MDGQMSLFGFDDLGFDTFGITGGEDVLDEEEVKTSGKEKKSEAEPAAAPEKPVKRSSSLKIKIDGVFVCMGCGKLLTKTQDGDKFKAYCNYCDVSYSGNN